MNNTWELIAHSLRDELQEYGGLLGLFEEQQAALFRRDAGGVLSLVHAIEEQARQASVKRVKREDLVREFALNQGRPPGSTLRSLVTLFPSEVRPMMEALIDEVNRLIHRSRKFAQQNVLLLQRAIEMHQEALRTLRPEAFTKTYSPRGQVSVAPATTTARSALEAVG
jgi:flagellar biosynthesis/type III secretory pathway chaperone